MSLKKKKKKALRGEIVKMKSKMGGLKPSLILLNIPDWINLQAMFPRISFSPNPS